jgi:hypothetical protein
MLAGADGCGASCANEQNEKRIKAEMSAERNFMSILYAAAGNVDRD